MTGQQKKIIVQILAGSFLILWSHQLFAANKKTEQTLYEGPIVYSYSQKSQGYVRQGKKMDPQYVKGRILQNIDKKTAATRKFLNTTKLSTNDAAAPQAIWQRVSELWSWLGQNIRHINKEYRKINDIDPKTNWPSMDEYAQYYNQHGYLAWAACFSKAHLFTTLLSQMGVPRDHFGIATAHYRKGESTTPSHVYVGLRVGNEWYYIDPTQIRQKFPNYENRKSIGHPQANKDPLYDYRHPFKFYSPNPIRQNEVPLLAQ